MFLEQTLKRNPELINTAFSMHQAGILQPDSYLIDVDTLLQNAEAIMKKAEKNDIRLFFMLKQLGRNPYIAKELVKAGYEGAVCVDFREAQIMMEEHIPICNIGHLVQVPEAQLESVIVYGPEMITVFSEEKIRSIDAAAKSLGRRQGILLRVYGEKDVMYSGQMAGFPVSRVKELVYSMQEKYKHVFIKGITAFPCYLYDEVLDDTVPTQNLYSVLEAARILEECNIRCEIVNTPSATCAYTLDQIKRHGGNCGEPGHGLTGTTPMHAVHNLEEIPCVVYLSEISHNFEGSSYCFGGGHYRRSHVSRVLTGRSREDAKILEVNPPMDESIDYYFGIRKECPVGDTAVMAFRFQIFVTRSDVVLLRGIQEGRPEIIGIYDSLGRIK